MITHGESKTKLNKVWRNIKDRCFNQNNKRYSHYGGRGITICNEWRDDYVCFRDWALSNGYAYGLSIDRINNDGNYEPRNCRWVDSIKQNNNFSRNRNITYRGKTLSISQWAKLSGLHRNTIDFRIKKGWDIEDVFNKPLQQHGRSESHIGNMITVS